MNSTITGEKRNPVNESPDSELSYQDDFYRSSDSKDFSHRILTTVNRMGFTDYSFINLDCANTLQNALSTLPKAMLSDYYKHDYYANDMVLQRGISNSSVFLSSNIYDYISRAPFDCEMTQIMNSIYQLYKIYGYYDSYNIPCNSPQGHYLLSVFIKGLSPVDFRHKVLGLEQSLILVGEAIESTLNKRFAKLLPTREAEPFINPKPLRVLNTLANSDLTIEQVAKKLSISVVTANQHLKTVRRSMSVKTNYAAIRRGLSEKLIKYEGMPEITFADYYDEH